MLENEVRHFMSGEKQISIGIDNNHWDTIQRIANEQALSQNWLAGKGTNWDYLNIWIIGALFKCPRNVEPAEWITKIAINQERIDSDNKQLMELTDLEIDEIFDNLGKKPKTGTTPKGAPKIFSGSRAPKGTANEDWRAKENCKSKLMTAKISKHVSQSDTPRLNFNTTHTLSCLSSLKKTIYQKSRPH